MTHTKQDNARGTPHSAHRQGISLMRLAEMFPDEESAVRWFEAARWPNEGDRHCPRCGSLRIHVTKDRKPMPYRCKDCRNYFSVRTGTMLECSRLPLRKWAFATYLYVSSLKGVSSMKLHRDLNVTQKTAWFMLHRLRDAWDGTGAEPFAGPVEADETYIGGKRRNMPNSERRKMREEGKGRGPVGKAAVVGQKDRETNRIAVRHVARTDAASVAGFVAERTAVGASVYTDEAAAYGALDGDYDHRAVNHSAGEYVRGEVHTNGIESFWAILKRAYMGTYHRLSEKHLERYVREFARRHNIRDFDTEDQMKEVVAGMVGRRLMYDDLIADNGLSAGAG